MLLRVRRRCIQAAGCAVSSSSLVAAAAVVEAKSPTQGAGAKSFECGSWVFFVGFEKQHARRVLYGSVLSFLPLFRFSRTRHSGSKREFLTRVFRSSFVQVFPLCVCGCVAVAPQVFSCSLTCTKRRVATCLHGVLLGMPTPPPSCWCEAQFVVDFGQCKLLRFSLHRTHHSRRCRKSIFSATSNSSRGRHLTCVPNAAAFSARQAARWQACHYHAHEDHKSSFL